ncbi:MAG: hypothetical protein ACOCJN_00750 [Spirochaetaceae bacterium JB067]
MIKNKTKRNVIAVVVAMVLLTVTLPAFALSPSGNLTYLHVVGATESDVLQFNEKGVYVESTESPLALDDGWVVLSGMDPVTIESSDITIVLQRESILSVVSNNKKHLKFYLVAGSASFLMDSQSAQKLTVNTPVGIYSATGSTELFVSSDISELIFSLGSSVDVTNTITRDRTTLSPFHYLDLADPFLSQKPISKQTYNSLSIAQERSVSSLLPSASVQDGITILTPSTAYESAKKTEAVEPEPVKAVEPEPVKAVEPEPVKAVEPEPVKAVEPEPVKAVEPEPVKAVEPEPVKAVEPEPVKTAETTAKMTSASERKQDKEFSVYIVHTNDMMGAIEESGISFAKLSTLIKWGKEVSDRNLILDAGNSVAGTALSDFNSGKSISTLLQLLQYDAIAPGTAEYAFGIDTLVEQAREARENEYLDVLAANVFDAEGNNLFDGYKIYDLEGFKVAVIGISAPETSVEDTIFYSSSFKEDGQALVDALKDRSDAVVLLGNLPSSLDITIDYIAENIKGLDLIIAGTEADAQDGGRRVDDTYIVNAGEKLSSIGIVELKVINGELDGIYAVTVTDDDINNPEQSALAQAFNIDKVSDDPIVSTYISSLRKSYAAIDKVEEVAEKTVEISASPAAAVKEPVKQVAEAPEKEQEKQVAEFEVKTSETKITTSSEKPPLILDYGIKTSFVATKDNVLSNESIKTGISINPYIQIANTRLGLQAFYLTSGSLFAPLSSDVNNLTIGSGTVNTLRGILRFVDYFYVGDENDNFYVVMDDSSPITYNNGYIVNDLAVASGPYEENLGLYAKARLGKLSLEAFVDDMYLTDIASSGFQNGGVNVGYEILPSFTLSLGSVINASRTLDDITAYPTIDFEWALKDTRTLQVTLFSGLTTTFDIAPFSITPLYDSTGATLLDQFSNFQITGGLNIGTLNWDLTFLASAENYDDPMVAFGSLNSTAFSGTRMLEDTGLYFTFLASGTYTGDKVSFNASYQVPVTDDFTGIVPLDSDSSVTGDIASISMSYSGNGYTGEIGIERVGFISAFSDILDFSDGFEGLLSDTLTLLTEDTLAYPYVSVSYTEGIFTLYADLSFLTDGTSRATIGTTLDLGKNVEFIEPVEYESADSLDVSFDLGTSYTRGFVSGSDDNYISIDPTLTVSDENFSVGIGPHLTVDPETPSLYYHSLSSPYSFSSGYSSTLGKTFDIVTDIASLIDHVTIGDTSSENFFELSRENTYSMGPLISSMDSLVDSELQSKLALESSIDTKYVDLEMYVNDLTTWQLGAMNIGISPFENYGAELNLSGVVSAKLSSSEKQFDILPTIEGVLPIIDKETNKLSVYGGFTTLVGYDTTDGFSQMFYNSSVSSFLARFNNYMFHAGFSSQVDRFSAGVEVSMQEGAVSNNMFNSLFSRDRASILADFDAAWADPTTSDGRTYTASASLGYEGDAFKLNAMYSVPMTTSFSLIEDEDLIQLQGSVDLDWVTLSATYARTGLIDAAQTFLGSSDDLLNRLLTFAIAPESVIRAGATISQGPVDLNASIGTYAVQTSDGTYNGTTYTDISPYLSIGANIRIF